MKAFFFSHIHSTYPIKYAGYRLINFSDIVAFDRRTPVWPYLQPLFLSTKMMGHDIRISSLYSRKKRKPLTTFGLK